MPVTLIELATSRDLVKRVQANLLDAISHGTLASGGRIIQEEIAEQLAVPRKPVLQALRLLRNDRFVLNAPDRGVLVAPRGVAAVVQIYQVRSALDALAGWQGGCAGPHQIRPKPHYAWPHSSALRGHQRHGGSRCCFYMAVFAASGSPLIAQTA